MNKTILRMALIALLVISAQATGTLAGTTGALTGYVVVQSGAAGRERQSHRIRDLTNCYVRHGCTRSLRVCIARPQTHTR